MISPFISLGHSNSDSKRFDGTKWVIRRRRSKTNRQYNGKRTGTKRQTMVDNTQETKNRETRTP